MLKISFEAIFQATFEAKSCTIRKVSCVAVLRDLFEVRWRQLQLSQLALFNYLPTRSVLLLMKERDLSIVSLSALALYSMRQPLLMT